MPRTAALVATTAIASVALAVTPAQAEGTLAGVTISNTATAIYDVDNVTQNTLSATASVLVDRKINLMVTATDSAPTLASPGANAIAAFRIVNLSNAPVDLALAFEQMSKGTTLPNGSKPDSFDMTGLGLFLDQDGGETYDPGSDPEVSFLDEMGTDQTRTVFLVGKAPNGVTTGSAAGVRLAATAREAGTMDSLGAVISATNGANSAQIDTVLADSAGAGDSTFDGVFSALDSFVVYTAGLTLTKTMRVVSDKLTGTLGSALIPGTVIEFCIIAANGEGNDAANQVQVMDPVPLGLTFDRTFGIRLNGTATAGVCNEDGNIGGMFSTNQVIGALNTIQGGQSATVRYRVVVN